VKALLEAFPAAASKKTLVRGDSCGLLCRASVCTCVWLVCYVCVYVYVYMRVHMHACSCVCARACVYACVRVCFYLSMCYRGSVDLSKLHVH